MHKRLPFAGGSLQMAQTPSCKSFMSINDCNVRSYFLRSLFRSVCFARSGSRFRLLCRSSVMDLRAVSEVVSHCFRYCLFCSRLGLTHSFALSLRQDLLKAQQPAGQRSLFRGVLGWLKMKFTFWAKPSINTDSALPSVLICCRAERVTSRWSFAANAPFWK